MIITTTNSIEGHPIVEYKGVVFGEVIEGVNLVRDIGAGLRDIFGGRSKSYENALIQARSQAQAELAANAQALGANAVVGLKLDYETLGEGNGMLMVIASGTAVVVQ